MEGGFVLNPLDIIIAAIIGFGMYRGASKGIFKRATTVVAIVIAIILGMRLRGVAENLFRDYLRLQASPEIIAFLSFALAFVVVFIVVTTLLNYLTEGLKKINFTIDKALGALFGGVTATLALSIAFILLSYVSFPSANHAQGSVLYPQVKNFSRYALGVGVNVLREANQQVTKFGVGGKAPNSSDTPPPPPPPGETQPETSKPKVIR